MPVDASRLQVRDADPAADDDVRGGDVFFRYAIEEVNAERGAGDLDVVDAVEAMLAHQVAAALAFAIEIGVLAHALTRSNVSLRTSPVARAA